MLAKPPGRIGDKPILVERQRYDSAKVEFRVLLQTRVGVALSHNKLAWMHNVDSLRCPVRDFHIHNARTSLDLRHQGWPLLGAGDGERILGKTALNDVARFRG